MTSLIQTSHPNTDDFEQDLSSLEQEPRIDSTVLSLLNQTSGSLGGDSSSHHVIPSSLALTVPTSTFLDEKELFSSHLTHQSCPSPLVVTTAPFDTSILTSPAYSSHNNLMLPPLIHPNHHLLMPVDHFILPQHQQLHLNNISSSLAISMGDFTTHLTSSLSSPNSSNTGGDIPLILTDHSHPFTVTCLQDNDNEQHALKQQQFYQHNHEEQFEETEAMMMVTEGGGDLFVPLDLNSSGIHDPHFETPV